MALQGDQQQLARAGVQFPCGIADRILTRRVGAPCRQPTSSSIRGFPCADRVEGQDSNTRLPHSRRSPRPPSCRGAAGPAELGTFPLFSVEFGQRHIPERGRQPNRHAADRSEAVGRQQQRQSLACAQVLPHVGRWLFSRVVVRGFSGAGPAVRCRPEKVQPAVGCCAHGSGLRRYSRVRRCSASGRPRVVPVRCGGQMAGCSVPVRSRTAEAGNRPASKSTQVGSCAAHCSGQYGRRGFLQNREAKSSAVFVGCDGLASKAMKVMLTLPSSSHHVWADGWTVLAAPVVRDRGYGVAASPGSAPAAVAAPTGGSAAAAGPRPAGTAWSPSRSAGSACGPAGQGPAGDVGLAVCSKAAPAS